eukprot:CAMPEP_0170143594 /NCGR_PEP_ID=MMETSP0033_2-20121228/11892_1 /TAXON_ID=195969 /ORGANISM="Dolichomastix tenuilepis, Strain CCMP3274" /LENGTH=465 /DNA_ID=CAMNT_0010380053 /DNA_START=15 /DNA_END=1412 /DNA_ORIENTATION=-
MTHTAPERLRASAAGASQFAFDRRSRAQEMSTAEAPTRPIATAERTTEASDRRRRRPPAPPPLQVPAPPPSSAWTHTEQPTPSPSNFQLPSDAYAAFAIDADAGLLGGGSSSASVVSGGAGAGALHARLHPAPSVSSSVATVYQQAPSRFATSSAFAQQQVQPLQPPAQPQPPSDVPEPNIALAALGKAAEPQPVTRINIRLDEGTCNELLALLGCSPRNSSDSLEQLDRADDAEGRVFEDLRSGLDEGWVHEKRPRRQPHLALEGQAAKEKRRPKLRPAAAAAAAVAAAEEEEELSTDSAAHLQRLNLERLFAHLATHLPQRASIVDVGCSSSFVPVMLASAFPASSIYFSDNDPRWLSYIQEQVSYFGLGVPLVPINCDVASLPSALPCAADLVIMLKARAIKGDRAAFLARLRDRLSPSGHVVLVLRSAAAAEACARDARAAGLAPCHLPDVVPPEVLVVRA